MSITSLTNILVCELCGAQLTMDVQKTTAFYSTYIINDLKDIKDQVDEIMAEFIVYRCSVCDHLCKYTYRDIEKAARRNLTRRFLTYFNKEVMMAGAIDFKYFIYCGKCQGFDGKGSCPQSIFDDCKIKRFPLNDI